MDDDEDRIRHVVYTRGLWDRADRYADHLKAREVEWVRAYNQLLLADAERYGFPVVRVEKSHHDAEKVLSALGLDTMGE